MEKCGIRKYRIMDILCFQYGGFDKFGCIKWDIYNFCHANKQETISAGDTHDGEARARCGFFLQVLGRRAWPSEGTVLG